ncbi:ChbG/HpnK family deacetylase [Rhizobium sp. RU36D]|uniref:ChbG/HpnK family deacetylase n=1 Tax=Rhizobium sp. RU36D TaxID=1907415 RepID=UPI0009D83499|nr:ChbG/HpnK family deacetylase [Rhizobium sp. RU36D]SMC81539.1 hypothetical protein SAMN05880593_107117 [Rhizobium sp. RU36D]
MTETAPSTPMPQNIVLVADDYGLAPGINNAIRTLIAAGRLSGTGCMTLFPEWPEAARQLKAMPEASDVAVGLHLTLTDFEPLSGVGPLGTGPMPKLSRLIRASYTGGVDLPALFRELDAQLAAFVQAMGRMPDYLDGHQHVHFLPGVRLWLTRRRFHLVSSGTPWLRGAPVTGLADGFNMKTKVAVVALLARGFDAEMAAAGFVVRGPLAGFYEWGSPASFAPTLRSLAARLPDGAVVMCHPGEVDEVLKSRDMLIAARPIEFQELMRFDGWRLARSGTGRGAIA